VAIGLLFLIFSLRDRSPILLEQRTHPHPEVRFYVVANFTWSSWRKVIPNIEDYKRVVSKAREDMLRAWATLKLPEPVAGEMDANTEAFWKAVRDFQTRFAEIGDRLNELSMRRLEAG
jgi:hypothetical protein